MKTKINSEKKVKLSENANAITEASAIEGVTSIRLLWMGEDKKPHAAGATKFKEGWTMRNERKTVFTAKPVEDVVKHLQELVTTLTEAKATGFVVHHLVRIPIEGAAPVAAEGEKPVEGAQVEGEAPTEVAA